MRDYFWNNDLPTDWKVKRADAVLEYNKNSIRIDSIKGTTFFHYSIPSIQETGDGKVEEGDEIESDKVLLEGNELLVSKLNPEKGCVLIAKPNELPIICSTEFVPLKPKPTFDTKYAFYIYFSEQAREFISSKSQSTTRSHKRVSPEDISKIWIPFPPLETQRRIAAYLDRETAHIDTLIAAKERLLVLMAEKRQALIARAVTRGLEEDVKLKDSGVAWLGEVPEGWEVVRLRLVYQKIEQGWSPQAADSRPNEDEWGVLKLNAVKLGDFDDTKCKALPLDATIPTNYEVKVGDFLVTRANTPSFVGDVCFVKHTRPKLIMSDLIYRLVLDETKILGQFLNYFLLTVGRAQIEADARGTSNSMVKISQEHISNWRTVLRPISEQQKIIDFIEKQTNKLDSLRQATERTIALLKERRSALIAAAVTGQIEIN